MQAADATPVLSRVEQQRHYGLDCGDAVRFDAGTWAPGGEHIKKISVRNVSKRTIKFKYELPTTKYFSMDFPTVLTLSPGMQTVLDVAFRPVKLEEYDDFVSFNVHIIEGGVTASSGKFKLPVIARIASLSVELPQGVDFGFCPTVETSHKSFSLRNNGQIDALFDWTIPGAGDHGSPFAVRPASGRVRAGEMIELTASFCPTIASVYVTTSACLVRPDDGEAFAIAPQLEKLMKISGISKFTHLSASESELNFGEILVGAQNTSRAPTEREFVLRNRSLVRASFQIANVESDHEPVFFFSPLSGVVSPESTLTVKVRYTPLSAGTFTCDHFDVLTPGGNTVRLTCKGRAAGPRVSIWKKNNESNFVATTSVNFQDVAVGKAPPSSRVITLRNESPVEVAFHFSCQQRGVFVFDRVNGKIAPYLDLNVTITFAPVQPGNFYRRFFLLIHNQSTLFVDVLGTAYDDKTRPSPFTQAHVDAYHLRARAGLGLLSPDQLETFWQDNGDELFLQGALRRIKQQDAALESLRKSRELDRSGGFASPMSRAGSSSSQASPLEMPPSSQILTRSGEASIAEVETCHEFFISVEDKSNALAVHGGALLDFGNCGIVQFPSKKTLQVANNTHGKVTCSWRVSMASGTSESGPTADAKVFQVFPESADIAAGGTTEFRVAFQPSHVNSYYFAELEGFVSFKSNRTFRLVNVETFAPPWCLVSSVCGNTFASPTEQFLSKLSFKLAKRKVHFPPCYLGDHVFQTILMENASDTPALFAFVSDPSETFACKPASGYIGAKSFHLVQIRFSPRKPKKYTHVLQCIVNNARSRPETVELVGICALPSLVVEEDDGITKDHRLVSSADARVFIKPTSMGLQSVRSITVANASRVPLVFKWEVPRKHQDVFRVAPKLGRLNGNERVSVECAFSPQEVREYVSRFVVAVKPISIASGGQQRKAMAATLETQTKIPVLQECTVKVQTKGTVGAILFEPETLQFETILVNTSACQSLCIVNVADCDLQFALHQRVQVESESVVLGGDAAGKLSFSETQGRIAAHSRKKIMATFLPSIAGKFTFEVSCAITMGDDGRQGQEQLSAYDRWGDSVQEDLARKTCVITAEASFPTVVIQDIRVPRLSSQLAWRQFQCRELNEYLSSPLSKEEELANSSAKGGGQSEHQESGGGDAGGLRRFAIPFSPAALGSETQQVFLKLKNPGSLVVQFRLRYPKEGNVEIEHWAETGAPSSEEVRLNAIIDSKVFGISPRKATLLPRQSILLALSYAYTSDAHGGEHDLPIFLEVDKGKRMVLELQGRTLGRNEPKLFVPQRIFHLSPVMLGEFRRLAMPKDEGDDDSEDRRRVSQTQHRPPVQQIEVFNRGESAFRLEVGANAFAKVNADSHGFPVLHCATTSEIVPARSSVFVEIEFNPIEAKRIEAMLILKAHGLMGKGYKEAVMLTVVATGYHPRQQPLAQVRDAMSTSAAEPPRRQLLAVPDQPACFVSDFVDFSHVPMYSQANQLVILQNEVKSNSSPSASKKILTFEWDATHSLVANGVLHFAPKSGELAPGEKAMIRVSLQALGDALVVNHDVACFVTYRAIESGTGGASSSPTKTSGSRGPETNSNTSELSKPRASVINRSTATQEAAGDKAAKTKATGGAQQPAMSLPGTSTATSLLLQKPGSKDSRKKSTGGGAVETKLYQGNNGKSSRRNDDSAGEAAAPRATPLFVRVYAHILPQSVFEKSYSREQVKRMPVPLLTTQSTRPVYVASSAPASRGEVGKSSLPSTATAAATSRFGRNPPTTPHTPLTAPSARSRVTTSSSSAHPITISGSSSAASLRESRTGAEKALCCDVLLGVMEALVVDAMNSSVVQEALELQTKPLPAPMRAIAHARGATTTGVKSQSLYPRARRSDDCQAILASIMDNTVLNILQELFHGDLEQELLCVPRKTVFPTSPKSKQLLKI